MCLYVGVGGCSLIKYQTDIPSGLFFLPEVPSEGMLA